MKKPSVLRKVISLALSAALVLSLTACQGKPAEQPKANSNDPKAYAGTEISFMIPEWGVPSDEMLKKFNEETGITVKVETVSWDDIRNKVATAANAKKAASDVVEVDWAWVGEFEAAGWLEPLNLSQDDIADIPSISSFTVGGKVLGIPYANDFRIGYYNTDAYKKAGLKEPKTWDDVAKQMKVLKEKKIMKYPTTLPLTAGEGTTTSLIWLTYLRDGKVFNDDNTLNKDSVLASLKYIDKLLKDGMINPANASAKDVDAYRQLTSGEAAFMVGPTSFVNRVNDKKESKVVGKVMPILPPGGTDKATQTMALVEGIGVNKFSEKKGAAELFVKWYTSKEGQKMLNEVQNSVPTRTSVLSELISNETIKNSGSMLDTSKLIQSPFPNGVPKYYTEMSSAIYNAVNKMALGNITPEKAFEEMDKKVTELAKSSK